MITCNECLKEKEIQDMYRHNQRSKEQVFFGVICKECISLKTNKDKDKPKPKIKRKKVKSHIEYLFVIKYGGMKQRATIKSCRSSAFGKDLCTREEFIKWCLSISNYRSFHRMYKDWVNSNYSMRLTPSIDRIDNTKGYSIENIQWVTQGFNSSKGNL